MDNIMMIVFIYQKIVVLLSPEMVTEKILK